MLVYVADFFARMCRSKPGGPKAHPLFFTWNLLDFETPKVRKSENQKICQKCWRFSEKFWEKMLDQIFI